MEGLNFGSGGDISPSLIATMQANLRSQAPWMSIIPTTYHDLANYNTADKPWADIGLTLDSQLFYFRDQKQFDQTKTTPCSSKEQRQFIEGRWSDLQIMFSLEHIAETRAWHKAATAAYMEQF